MTAVDGTTQIYMYFFSKLKNNNSTKIMILEAIIKKRMTSDKSDVSAHDK